MNLLELVITVAIIEIALVLIVNIQRRSFPWLITHKDELPFFDKKALKKFIEYSFDPHLGWTRKQDSTGTEKGQKGTITFHIDSLGSRSNKSGVSSPEIAAFGDSYTFCRQVEDDETWEVKLSESEGYGVLNFGVGNYGIDQALLRYESMSLPESVRIVVLGFVPETICRIQSYWKHYLEFGNTFAFKPRFVLDGNGALSLKDNIIKRKEDFDKINEMLPEIQDVDIFYKRKFRSYQFRFPYVVSLFSHPVRHGLLMAAIAYRGIFRFMGLSNTVVENYPFKLIMEDNLLDAYKLYRDRDSTKLLSSILIRFKKKAELRGHTPLFVVIPQLLDLKLIEGKKAPYSDFFQEAGKTMPVLDLTETLYRAGYDTLYVNDQYGGHLSVKGNQLVASEISKLLKELNLQEQYQGNVC